MKRRVPIIMVCILSLMLLGCGRPVSKYNHKADDVISHAVYKAIGAKELYYQGKDEDRAGTITYYEFYIHKEKEGVIEEAVSAINTVLEQEKTSHNISVQFKERMAGGYATGCETLFRLGNFMDNDSSSAVYGKLQYLCIWGTNRGNQESIYNDPETYKNFPDIRYLRVSPKIQKAADEAGIDWYEYWPDLETVEVYSSED
ncbi:MAG: hypothetical protein NC345_06495 [Lachnospira sp.]|nr:hypothetical protein [Lachnospira sp.]